jgi:hypothetical protein
MSWLQSLEPFVEFINYPFPSLFERADKIYFPGKDITRKFVFYFVKDLPLAAAVAAKKGDPFAADPLFP